jgi:hypothetical protein
VHRSLQEAADSRNTGVLRFAVNLPSNQLDLDGESGHDANGERRGRVSGPTPP